MGEEEREEREKRELITNLLQYVEKKSKAVRRDQTNSPIRRISEDSKAWLPRTSSPPRYLQEGGAEVVTPNRAEGCCAGVARSTAHAWDRAWPISQIGARVHIIKFRSVTVECGSSTFLPLASYTTEQIVISRYPFFSSLIFLSLYPPPY